MSVLRHDNFMTSAMIKVMLDTTFQMVILNYDNCPTLRLCVTDNSSGSIIEFLFLTS